MIIINLKGGLGNQMFQYAAARSLSLKLNARLKLDTSFLSDHSPHEHFTLRDYELDIFTFPQPIATQKELDKFFKIPFSGKRFDKLQQSLNHYHIFREKHFHFNRDFFNQGKNTFLDGYFQSEKYFKMFESQIRQDFSFNCQLNEYNQKMIDLIQHTNSVAVHFRRKDYISNPITNKAHGVCSMEYYKNALQIIEKNVSNPSFFIFSDDIAWVKENWKFNFPVTFIENQNVQSSVDLYLMSTCKHFVIANSSFSWWGAWLSVNKNKNVIAPIKWFNDNHADTKDLYLKSWIKI